MKQSWLQEGSQQLRKMYIFETTWELQRCHGGFIQEVKNPKSHKIANLQNKYNKSFKLKKQII